jgi:hypothetical protein
VLGVFLAACGRRADERADDPALTGGGATPASAAGSDGAGTGGGAAIAGASGTAGSGGSPAALADSGSAGADSSVDAGFADAASAGTGGADAASGASGSGPSANNDCLDHITDFANPGPFAFEQVTSGSVKMWIPDVPAGCKVPVVHFSNGTGASCSSYMAALEHLASHGFLTTCYESPATGDGAQCVTAIETALAEYPDLADTKIGSGGHQTGGGGALICVARLEAMGGALQVVGHASEPDLSGVAASWPEMFAAVTSPIFIFNGSEDQLVSEQATRHQFDALAPGLEAYWYEATGAPHIPVPVKWMKESMVAWFRWKLLGDRGACEHVKAMPDSDDWDLQAVRNATDC